MCFRSAALSGLDLGLSKFIIIELIFIRRPFGQRLFVVVVKQIHVFIRFL